MKKWLFCLLALALIYGFIELMSFIGLFTLKKRYHLSYEPADVISRRHTGIINELLRDTSSYIKVCHELGWTIREAGKTELYTANSAGMRGTKEYEILPPAGKFRIMLCGDGFTHCNDVRNEEAWPALLEKMNTDWEVLNLGVWGYALDQAYLRYLEKGIQYKSHIVLIGFGSDNIFGLVNTYRPFMFRHTGLPLTKPRYRIVNGSLKLIPNPMRFLDDYKTLLNQPKEMLSMIGINDYYYEHRYESHMIDFSPTIKLVRTIAGRLREEYDYALLFEGEYTKNPEALDIMMKLIDTFHERVVENESIPIFCIFPLEHDIRHYRTHGTKRYSSLLTYFENKGYQYIDGMNAFDSLGENFNIGDLYSDFYTVIGNQLVAKYINESLFQIISETY